MAKTYNKKKHKNFFYKFLFQPFEKKSPSTKIQSFGRFIQFLIALAEYLIKTCPTLKVRFYGNSKDDLQDFFCQSWKEGKATGFQVGKIQWMF